MEFKETECVVKLLSEEKSHKLDGRDMDIKKAIPHQKHQVVHQVVQAWMWRGNYETLEG